LSTGYPPSDYPTPPPGYGASVRRRASRWPGPPPSGPFPRQPTPRSWFKRYLPWIALFLAILTSGVFGYLLLTLRDVPDPGAIPVLAHSIVVYDRKGRQIAQINSQGQYYESLHLADMGYMNQWATIAAEDRGFYQHSAIDPLRTVSAAASDVLHRGNLQGGSTITQQVVKISVLTPQRSIFRKLQEATLAFGLESRYTKDQILEMYLNRVGYGHNAYGIGAAAKVYFGAGTDAKNLTAGQAAFLAGLINGPSYYDPTTNYEGAKERQLYVLDGMVKIGKLSQADADKAAQEDVKSELKYDRTLLQNQAPHFVDYVIRRVEKTLGAENVPAGLQIHTTLDLDLQNLAQQAVTNGVSKLKGFGVNNGDLLAANPQTGEILAWVGSADFTDQSIAGQVDVVESPRQPGSSFKPYVFAAALKDHAITLSTTVHDTPTDFGGVPPFKPQDFDNSFLGDMTARRALLLSRNVPAVEVAKMEGIDRVIQEAHAQGINADLKPYLSTAIGSGDVTMLEHLQGYQVFADQGTRVPLIAITSVTDAAQNDLIPPIRPGSQGGKSQPLTPAQAYLITDTLKDYPSQWHLGWKRQMAGKSGTTDTGDGRNLHPDAWMMAYNPQIVVGAWAGNTNPTPPNFGKPTTAYGVNVGQQILAQFINNLPSGMSGWYQRPSGIVNGSGCSGQSSGSGEIYLAGTEGGVSCPTPSPTPTPLPTLTPTPEPSSTPTPSPTPRSSPHPSPSP
jgi:membrane peptidoglycan carboxypeptidase